MRLKTQVRDLLRERHRLSAGQEDDFSVENLADVLQIKETSTRAFAALVAAIASVSLLVGGIGIMNIMLVSVPERVREIGIRMALGARQADIMAQFLIEAAALSLAGGAIGIAIGVAGAIGTAWLADWPVVISPQAIAAGDRVAARRRAGFGFYPARRRRDSTRSRRSGASDLILRISGDVFLLAGSVAVLVTDRLLSPSR